MELYDTTLRDGAQSRQLHFSLNDRLDTLRLLDDFGVDFVELGWPGASESDDEFFSAARKLNLNAKTAAFGCTKRPGPAALDKGLASLINAHTDVCTIFGKTDPDHVRLQLKCSPKENLDAIAESVAFLSKKRDVFYDAEHFFDGYAKDSGYALSTLLTAAENGAKRIVLCDTNGGMLPQDVLGIVRKVSSHLEKQKVGAELGIHTHNDSGCAVANALVAAKHLTQIQVTINGVGERTGNADLCQIAPALVFKLGMKLGCDLEKLTLLSRKFDEICNLSPLPSRPYVGDFAFSHKGGVHVDAVIKGASYEHVDPRAVGNEREVVLSDLSGRSTIVRLLEDFNISVEKTDERVRAMMDDVEKMEGQGYRISDLSAEKKLLVSKHFFGDKSFFSIRRWKVLTEKRDSEFSECVVTGVIDNKERSVVAALEDKGPVAALYQALKQLISSKYKSIKKVRLSNYRVQIAEPKQENSTVRVAIDFSNGSNWTTVGVSSNVIQASLEAIEKGFRYFLLERYESGLPL